MAAEVEFSVKILIVTDREVDDGKKVSVADRPGFKYEKKRKIHGRSDNDDVSRLKRKIILSCFCYASGYQRSVYFEPENSALFTTFSLTIVCPRIRTSPVSLFSRFMVRRIRREEIERLPKITELLSLPRKHSSAIDGIIHVEQLINHEKYIHSAFIEARC